MGSVASRLFDLALALLLLAVLGPLLMIRGLWSWWRQGAVFALEDCAGRGLQPFKRFSFRGEGPAREWPVLLNILKGQMAFAGPRPLPCSEANQPGVVPERFARRPGLFSPHRLRSMTGIAFSGEAEEDGAFYTQQTLRGDLALMARSLLALVLAGGRARPAPPRLRLLGVEIDNRNLR